MSHPEVAARLGQLQSGPLYILQFSGANWLMIYIVYASLSGALTQGVACRST